MPRFSERTLLIKILSPLLFSAPDRYLCQLSKIKPLDFLAQKKDWGQFIAAFEKQWNEFILYVRLFNTSSIFYEIDCYFRQQFY